jgi:anhydro-N-acetylmuramic acid kinase
MMSGTSLDGLDIAHCTFSENNNVWSFTVESATTIPYSTAWKSRLKKAPALTPINLKNLDIEYGIYLGKVCNDFIKTNKIKADLIASHGHTIFHQPQQGITLQIGDGNKIAEITNLNTVYDFRSLDVKLGGQGAPLVPIGDQKLFSEFDFCINLGGFANISFEKNNQRIAFDICPVNIVINEICESIGKRYDKGGSIAKRGQIDQALLKELNNISYYQQLPPKSLGKEWMLQYINPIIECYQISVEDKLRTFYEHIAIQLSTIINTEQGNKVLISGGGTYNTFLIDLLRSKTNKEIYIPSKKIIEFKEALIFAFLGTLRLRGENNCLSSATGAKEDCCGGVLTEVTL